MVYTNNRNDSQLSGIDKDNCPEVTWEEGGDSRIVDIECGNVGCRISVLLHVG
jgi:hypothetical protein